MSQASLKLPKKLIIACDGTWQDSTDLQQYPTNITRIGRAISNYDDENHQQIVYYQSGVGSTGGLTHRLIGGATGRGLAEHIREAYAFLASNYTHHDDPVKLGGEQHNVVPPRDSIFLIGFSRGAYTARSVGGLLGAVGLLKKEAMQYFYEIFEDWQCAGKQDYTPKFFDKYFVDPVERAKCKPADSLAHVEGAVGIDKYMKQYREQLISLGLSQEVTVNAIGVFDTVGSLGIPLTGLLRWLPWLPPYIRDYAWLDTRIGDHVKAGFQALALDERRAPYHPAVWERPDDCKAYIKQVWFPGAHSNVGGGGHIETGINDLTIVWMMDHLAGHDLAGRTYNALDWIKFDEAYIERFFDQRVRRYELKVKEHRTTAPFRGWGLGSIYSSYNIPNAILGKKVRTPGQYHFVSYINGREDPKQLLKNTNEFVHASVRTRIVDGGRASEPDWDRAIPWGLSPLPWIEQFWYTIAGKSKGHFWPLYNPTARGQPLHDWSMPDKTIDIEDSRKNWHYFGKKKLESNDMPQDKLGKYELILQRKDEHFKEISRAQ